VIEVRADVDGRGDGSGVSEEALAAVVGAEVYFGYGLSRPLFLAATVPDPTLRWVHSATAGIGAMLYPEMIASDVTITNSAGVHAPAIAETVIAMVLYFARGLDIAVSGQQRSEWRAQVFERTVGPAREVGGATLGVIGLGGIGQEVAWRARGLGMRVVGLRRRQGISPEGVELLSGDDALDRLLGQSDYVVISVPATPATRGLIGRRELNAMKPQSVLINVARGEIIADDDALADVLRSGHLRGAALDVFREEPLPADSALWTTPNLLVTPHVSGTTDRFWSRETTLIVDNVGRYLAGEPLHNVVDKKQGY
jgi:phosphoglycerate dehydrogenase-like enzyme